MRIEVGNEYVNRNGDVICIVSSDDTFHDDRRMVFFDQRGDSYYEDGSYWDDDCTSDFDLISLHIAGEM